ncbi:MAG TPA: hypothetical protein P5268_10485 [Candidatus Marinimicrobia bacterium]|nr:hypothetical protein [Candidatus Neomarinimicrobiota bacterium]
MSPTLLMLGFYLLVFFHFLNEYLIDGFNRPDWQAPPNSHRSKPGLN